MKGNQRGFRGGFEGLGPLNPQPTLNQPSTNPQATLRQPPLKGEQMIIEKLRVKMMKGCHFLNKNTKIRPK
jgi:hypothetical protein